MTIGLQLSDLTMSFFLVAARVAGIVVSAPMISAQYIPKMLRVALVFMLALVVSPTLPALSAAQTHTVMFLLTIAVQFAIGVLIGLVLTLFYSVFAIAGQAVTYQLGVGLAVTASPGLLSANSFLAEWETLLALFVFVVAGGPELLIIALHSSFQAIPLDALSVPMGAIGFVTGLMETVLTIALLVAGPLLLSGLVVNLAVGVLSRAFPQMNAYFVALPVNFGVSLVVFLAMLPLLFAIIPEIWHTAWTNVSRLLVLLEGRTG
ncbi:MAG: flagellar biosynthetic protein FliR [Sulfobacillus sp.]